MNDIDQKIRNALKGSAEGDELAREPNIAEELIGTFRARHRWVHGIAFAYSFVLFVGAVWAGYLYFHAETPHEQLQWAGLALLAMMFVGFIKIYFWMEMHTNRVLRELKRVELLFLQRER